MSFQDQERRRLREHALRTWVASSHVIGYDVASETLHETFREGALEYFRPFTTSSGGRARGISERQQWRRGRLVTSTPPNWPA